MDNKYCIYLITKAGDLEYMVSSIKEEMKKIKIPQVVKFLSDLNICIEKGDCVFIDRADRRNGTTLGELGYKTLEVLQTLQILDFEDFVSGPEPNTSPNVSKIFKDGDVWTFGKVVTGLCTMEVYIKVSFAEFEGENYTCCISFHRPDFNITYPLK